MSNHEISQQELNTLIDEAKKNQPAHKTSSFSRENFLAKYKAENKDMAELMKELNVSVRQEEVDALIKN